jgi:hypothetical protein
MITILHLSDVHLSNPKLPDFGFVRDALLKDLTDHVEHTNPIWSYSLATWFMLVAPMITSISQTRN